MKTGDAYRRQRRVQKSCVARCWRREVHTHSRTRRSRAPFLTLSAERPGRGHRHGDERLKAFIPTRVQTKEIQKEHTANQYVLLCSQHLLTVTSLLP
ncbi:hypothetical protein BV25DRAFT_490895 [Artomyces pyxidatus]|uniref:Uncharacterized protein n=1 Tax=Artomyces pyxidatus TaxID=48021 RepID=A0ACB8T4F5_9AGAM|nr:hypothetical protein BV25DRAFT_490895 [Artomyces pyxidatus]